MLHPAGEERLRRAGLHVRVVDASDEQEVEAWLPRADGIVVRLPAAFDAGRVAQARRAKILSVSGAGADHVDIVSATSAGIGVVNNPGVGARAVAEHAVGLMLALVKRIPLADRLLREQGWPCREAFHGVAMAGGLSGRSLGLVGFGQIARQVAHICHRGFDMPVTVFSRRRPVDCPYSWCADLGELAAGSDFLSLHLPLTETTRGLVSREVIFSMPRTAYLINTARGGVIDNEALCDALKARAIAGAGIDVFDDEPPSPDEPLLTMDNAIVTPHVAGISEDSCRRLAISAAEQIIQALNGDRPPHLLNPDAWADRGATSKEFKN